MLLKVGTLLIPVIMQVQILVKQRDPESTVQKRTVKAGTGEDSTLEDKALEKKMRETGSFAELGLSQRGRETDFLNAIFKMLLCNHRRVLS